MTRAWNLGNHRHNDSLSDGVEKFGALPNREASLSDVSPLNRNRSAASPVKKRQADLILSACCNSMQAVMVWCLRRIAENVASRIAAGLAFAARRNTLVNAMPVQEAVPIKAPASCD